MATAYDRYAGALCKVAHYHSFCRLAIGTTRHRDLKSESL